MYPHLARACQWSLLAVYIVAIATVSLMGSEGYRVTCREFDIKSDKLDDDNVDLGVKLWGYVWGQ